MVASADPLTGQSGGELILFERFRDGCYGYPSIRRVQNEDVVCERVVSTDQGTEKELKSPNTVFQY
jgi:hypothetical protein